MSTATQDSIYIDVCLLVHAGGPVYRQGFPSVWMMWESLQFMESKLLGLGIAKHYRHLVGSVDRKWKAQRPERGIL